MPNAKDICKQEFQHCTTLHFSSRPGCSNTTLQSQDLSNAKCGFCFQARGLHTLCPIRCTGAQLFWPDNWSSRRPKRTSTRASQTDRWATCPTLLEGAVHPLVGKPPVNKRVFMQSAPANQIQKQRSFRAKVNACIMAAHTTSLQRIEHALQGPLRHDPRRFL